MSVFAAERNEQMIGQLSAVLGNDPTAELNQDVVNYLGKIAKVGTFLSDTAIVKLGLHTSSNIAGADSKNHFPVCYSITSPGPKETERIATVWGYFAPDSKECVGFIDMNGKLQNISVTSAESNELPRTAASILITHLFRNA